ncbi:MAG: class I SAM-dependent methyltransferase [Lachnospiraceae bacterium]|nr:class I SAM-dependent methyltransferase [Lachnospiraceae bacterium]
MYISDKWKEYEVIDASAGEKLERWGDYILVRPDPQVIWDTPKEDPLWHKANGIYHRSSKGGGSWEFFDLPDEWQIHYGKLTFNLKPFAFKHTGLFPEQAANWDWAADLIRNAGRQIRILNLFAYTGGATMSAVLAGGHVTHVDASKGMTGWAKENEMSSDLPHTSFRYIVEDCSRFVEREIRRGSRYDAVIMDPPSYGRGPKGEIWKIEESVFPLILKTEKLLSDDPLFFLINSYTTGLQSAVLTYMMEMAFKNRKTKLIEADEVGLPVRDTKCCLPCGCSGRTVFGR